MNKETQELFETLAEICEELHKIRDILELMEEERKHEQEDKEESL